MALPSPAEILAGGIWFNGEPFVQVEAKSGIDSLHNGYWFNGEPFVVASLGATLTGVQGTGQVGNLTAALVVSAALTGVEGAGSVGSFSITSSSTIALTGVGGVGEVGTIMVGNPSHPLPRRRGGMLEEWLPNLKRDKELAERQRQDEEITEGILAGIRRSTGQDGEVDDAVVEPERSIAQTLLSGLPPLVQSSAAARSREREARKKRIAELMAEADRGDDDE